MADNDTSVGCPTLRWERSIRVIFVQVLVALFVCINLLQIATFSMKHVFYTTMRYILFAHMLLSDCVILIGTNVLLILSYCRLPVPLPLCVVLYILTSPFKFCTPLTLTAMTLERYVAICVPLRHAELCSTRSAMLGLLVIHGLSAMPWMLVVTLFFMSATFNVVTHRNICSVEIFILHQWQAHLRSAVNQFYFLVMFIAIFFCYVKIAKSAKAASGEDRTSSRKGLKTVILHAFQLLLTLIQLWCPLVETAALQVSLKLYSDIRYMNYILFYLASRCISPLIYGLRDEKFFLALKHLVLCGFIKNKSLKL